MMQCTPARSIFIEIPLFNRAKQAALIAQAISCEYKVIQKLIHCMYTYSASPLFKLTPPPFSISKICKIIADLGYKMESNADSHVFLMIFSLSLSATVTSPAFEWYSTSTNALSICKLCSLTSVGPMIVAVTAVSPAYGEMVQMKKFHFINERRFRFVNYLV